MSINEQNSNSKYTPDRYQSEKSYNDVRTKDSQVLAPFVIRDKSMLVNKDVNQDNLKTFNIYGKRILVGFVPVERDEFANALRVFNMDTNEYLSRHSKGKHDDLSLDEMFEKMDNDEKFGYDPTGISSHEEKLMLIETLEELIDVVYQRNEKYGKILKLIYQDVTISKQEIIEKLGMKKTQGYEAIKKAHALAKEVYKELNQ
ncbi:hypothetical protein DP112_06215 [Streptococcus suis]|uniref:hypothetical protein n=2 Tax=Streptococcus suis TaxID=1307 RepID=UPI000E0A8146|nr:hypothetical protein [Streptococcus suis]MBY5034616.1 hypothetical protein [Streptococcus gallolyticus]QGJ85236.1 hypothetical protein [Streptococcus phage phi-SgaBSJ27_rum]QGJ85347.1 hypothetical protein [Streptococcus phage phi-SgaBSJ31_rum]AXI67671.1 hypothetical protein DP112_06215 [Streptococcus suis]MBO3642486.1 hypothetical protein [Streptococcus suis]